MSEWWRGEEGRETDNGPIAELLSFTDILETLREAYQAHQVKKSLNPSVC